MREKITNSIRLSVILTNYNYSSFLRERIQSILNQLNSNDELIVIDDASDDSSVSIIEQFFEKNTRLRLIKNQCNQGPARSANLGVQVARGQYLSWLATDDRLLPGFVEKTIKILLKHPEIGVACSDVALWYDGFPGKISREINKTALIEGVKDPIIFSKEEIPKIFWTTNFWIPGHASIMKRSLVLQYGGFQEGLGPYCDWFLLHAIALRTGAAYIPEVLTIYRKHPNTYSGSIEKNNNLSLKFQMNLLRTLDKAENKDLNRLFKITGLLRPIIRPRLFRFCLYPRYWSIIERCIRRAFIFRFKKICKIRKVP